MPDYVCLAVPAHTQDCTGYCGPGCVTMIMDAFGHIGSTPAGGFSQFNAYRKVYRLNPEPGFPEGKGAYDRWHISPKQLQTILNQKLPYEAETIELKMDQPMSDQGAAIEKQLTIIREGLDHGMPAIMLMAYDEHSRVPHATGTHWVVVRGYNMRNGSPPGYYTLDPWRRWKTGLDGKQSKEGTHHKHVKCEASPPPNSNGLPASSVPAPEVVASWCSDPSGWMHDETPLSPGQEVNPDAADMAANLFRGARTDGRACILTVPKVKYAAPELKNKPKPARTETVPGSWPLWLKDALAGVQTQVPYEFVRALPQGVGPEPEQELIVHRTDAARKHYRLCIWPLQQATGLRLMAWVTGDPANPTVHGASVVRNWPPILNENDLINSTGFKCPMPDPAPAWPERKELLARIEAHVKGASQLPPLPPLPPVPTRVRRLVWEPCPLSLSPALPFYEVEADLAAWRVNAKTTRPPRTVRFLVTPDHYGFLRAARGSKAGG